MVEFLIFICIITPFLSGYIKKRKQLKELKISHTLLQRECDKWRSTAGDNRDESYSKTIDKEKQTELLSIVATQTENAIMIMDPEGNIEWINEGFTRMYGYTFDEFIETRGSNIRQTSFSSIIEERLYKCKILKQPVFYDAPNITRDGREIWTRTTLTPIFNDKGEVIHLATIDTDIDRRKRAADVLLKELSVLRQRLNQLTHHQQKVSNVINHLLHNQKKSGKEVEATKQIISFINDVSDRVKIMGLNASIEAATIARNGQKNMHEAGFRVLASEIIKLSEETKTKSSEIGKIINRLDESFDVVIQYKNEVENTTRLFMQNITRLEEGLKKVEEVAEKLNE